MSESSSSKSDVRPAVPQPPTRSGTTPPDGPELLEKIVAHFTAQMRKGKRPSIAKYQKKFPQLADEIEELLASVAMIEQLKQDSDESAAPSAGKFDSLKGLTQIGSYQIVREIGRGGMGVVFEGVHESLGRHVAIKVMPSPMMDAEKHVARFKREASAAARLHHTNIVSVYGVGEEQGFYYYVMDYIRGTSLSNAIFDFKHQAGNSSFQPWRQETRGLTRTGGGASPTRVGASEATGSFEVHQVEDTQTYVANTSVPDKTVEMSVQQPAVVTKPAPKQAKQASSQVRDAKYFRWVAELGADLADALSYAHSFKILHRDIKPSNLLLDEKGGIWITDFGLVKDESSELNLTRTGDVIGTPQYLAPESLEGKYDSRSEIYCLGLTLYEMVTLESAYRGSSPAEIIRAIATQSPKPAQKINQHVPLDLSTIIAKAISREPESRYASATDLRDDLLAFVDDRPIQARPPSFGERIWRWARRNPLPASLAAVSALLLTMVAVVASIGYWTTTDALAKEADKSRKLAAEKVKSEANLNLMEEQYNRAEANIAVTMNVFDSIFRQYVGGDSNSNFEMDGFRDIAGIEDTLSREEVQFLKSMLGFYEQVAELNKDNERLVAETARAYRRVGNLLQLVGDLDASIEAYKISLKRYEPLWEASSDEKQVLLERVAIQNELASAYKKNRGARLSHSMLNNSIQLLQESPLSETDNDVKLELARSLSISAVNLYRFLAVGQSPIASVARERTGMRRPFGGKGSESPMGRMRKRGMQWQDLIRGDRKGNVRILVEQAIEILDDLIKEDSENAEYRSVRGICYAVMSVLEREDRSVSLDNYRLAVKELSGLVEQFPESTQFRYFLAITYSNSLERSPKEELAGLENSIEQTRVLIEKFPGRIEFHQLLVSNVLKVVKFKLRERSFDQAFRWLQTTESSIKFLLERSTSEMNFRSVEAQVNMGVRELRDHYRQTNQMDRAKELDQWRRSILSRRMPASPERG